MSLIHLCRHSIHHKIVLNLPHPLINFEYLRSELGNKQKKLRNQKRGRQIEKNIIKVENQVNEFRVQEENDRVHMWP